jgi:hypothetical protein
MTPAPSNPTARGSVIGGEGRFALRSLASIGLAPAA